MSYIMVDIEADGPIPGDYSMVCFGAVVVEPGLERTFYGELRPISDRFVPEALAVSGFTREQVMAFPEPQGVMHDFAAWIARVGGGRPTFISDMRFDHFCSAPPVSRLRRISLPEPQPLA